MTSDHYLPFVPPDHLANKERANWNQKEAKEYRDWLLSVQQARVEELLRRLDAPRAGKPAAHLDMLGSKVADLLGKSPFSEDSSGGRKLTKLGYALAADMGLLIAQYLLSVRPEKLKWEIVRKPKSELSYNLPVIAGFSNNYLDPIGGSIAEASAILRGQRGPDAWRKIYEFWVEKA